MAVLVAAPALAGPEGRIRVIDADTIRVGDETVRLFGIDAPETDQTCTRPGGEAWDCGLWAAQEVRARYEGGRAVCQTLDRDRYGRTVARCAANGGDMGEAIVKAGLATAYQRYSMDYVETEKAAVVAGRGIFAGGVETPSDYRAAQRAASAQPIPDDCPIKGNISRSGRIYHAPGQADYDATRIDETRGERWFCSEAEAVAAGWRKARR